MYDRTVQCDQESVAQHSVSSLSGDAEPSYELSRCVIFTTQMAARLVLASLETASGLGVIETSCGEWASKRERGYGKSSQG